MIALTLLAGGCAWHGTGPNPVLYPWDQPRPKAGYCIMSLELPGARGITVGGKANGRSVDLVCKPPPRSGAQPTTKA